MQRQSLRMISHKGIYIYIYTYSYVLVRHRIFCRETPPFKVADSTRKMKDLAWQKLWYILYELYLYHMWILFLNKNASFAQVQYQKVTAMAKWIIQVGHWGKLQNHILLPTAEHQLPQGPNGMERPIFCYCFWKVFYCLASPLGRLCRNWVHDYVVLLLFPSCLQLKSLVFHKYCIYMEAEKADFIEVAK